MRRFFAPLLGQVVATIVVAAWEGDIDRAQAHRVLNGQRTTDTAAILDTPVAEPQTA
ncbi:hypothetical protein [Methylobacterium sp. E-005]|uniref:hypothetical protein n=1 Tax=Methylobacterium sp. E-005 TaxID=2836549 RepID=UPI0039194D1B